MLRAALNMSSSVSTKYSPAGTCLKEQQENWGATVFRIRLDKFCKEKRWLYFHLWLIGITLNSLRSWSLSALLFLPDWDCWCIYTLPCATDKKFCHRLYLQNSLWIPGRKLKMVEKHKNEILKIAWWNLPAHLTA